jgi:hypothetical protein
MKALIPVRPGAQVAKAPEPTGATIIRAGQEVPRRVQDAVSVLLTEFKAGSGQPEGDAITLTANRYAVCEGFPMAIVLYTFKQLLRFNPNGQFRPSTTCVYEHLCKAEDLFKARVWSWFSIDELFWGREDRPRKFGDDWGPAPLQPGCYIPRELVMQWLREFTACKRRLADLVRMPQARFDAIPADGFKDGVRDKLIAEREEHARRRAEEADECERERLAQQARNEACDRRREAALEAKRKQLSSVKSSPVGAISGAVLDCERRMFKRLEEEALEESRRHAEGNGEAPQTEAVDDGRAYW